MENNQDIEKIINAYIRYENHLKCMGHSPHVDMYINGALTCLIDLKRIIKTGEIPSYIEKELKRDE